PQGRGSAGRMNAGRRGPGTASFVLSPLIFAAPRLIAHISRCFWSLINFLLQSDEQLLLLQQATDSYLSLLPADLISMVSSYKNGTILEMVTPICAHST